jgi:hypothetical protein
MVATMTTPWGATLRRLARLVWIQVSVAKNPWFEAAASEEGNEHRLRWEGRNTQQLLITRELFAVVFHGAEPTEDLLARALDFLDGR